MDELKGTNLGTTVLGESLLRNDGPLLVLDGLGELADVVPVGKGEEAPGNKDAPEDAHQDGALTDLLSGVDAAPRGLKAGAGGPVVEGEGETVLGHSGGSTRSHLSSLSSL